MNHFFQLQADRVLSRSDLEGVVAEIVNARNNAGISNVILDMRKTENAPSATEIFRAIALLPENIKLALIYNCVGTISQLISFSGCVAGKKNKQVRAFGSVETATSWFRET